MALCYLVIIGLDNGFPPARHRVNVDLLSIRQEQIAVKFNQNTDKSSVKKIHFKIPCTKWQPFCSGINVLKHNNIESPLEAKE